MTSVLATASYHEILVGNQEQSYNWGESPSTSDKQVQGTYPKPETGLSIRQLMASWRRIFPCVF